MIRPGLLGPESAQGARPGRRSFRFDCDGIRKDLRLCLPRRNGAASRCHLGAAPGACRIVAETSTFALADKTAAERALAAAGVMALDCPLSVSGSQAALLADTTPPPGRSWSRDQTSGKRRLGAAVGAVDAGFPWPASGDRSQVGPSVSIASARRSISACAKDRMLATRSALPVSMVVASSTRPLTARQVWPGASP